MKIKILQDTFIKGKPVKAGTEVDCDKSDAHVLIGYGRAKVASLQDAKAK